MAPCYDYSCKDCGNQFEVIHSMNDKRDVACPKCHSIRTSKMVSLCGIIIGNNRAQSSFRDRAKREGDQRQDLLQNYGVENVTPLAKGMTFPDIYSQVKMQGDLVREQMAQRKEIDTANQKVKRKEWLIGARKRAPQKAKIMAEKKAQEKAAKNRIVL